jgi:hypothetical protein
MVNGWGRKARCRERVRDTRVEMEGKEEEDGEAGGAGGGSMISGLRMEEWTEVSITAARKHNVPAGSSCSRCAMRPMCRLRIRACGWEAGGEGG